MALSSSQLEAFATVAKTANFSQAAKLLHVTQSALSQRVMNLEEELGTSLLIRDPAGLRLTAFGEELLRYHNAKAKLEEEVLANIANNRDQIGGVLRIAGISSVIRSIIMPSLEAFVRRNSAVRIELINRELRDLPRTLANAEVDFIVTADGPFKNEIESQLLGYEENVLVEAVDGGGREDQYLDHDAADQTTTSFLKNNHKNFHDIKRSFCDEIYGIIDAVKLGWGRAVVPKHLIGRDEKIRIIKGLKPLKIPIYLQYYQQAYYSKLHDLVKAEILKNVTRFI